MGDNHADRVRVLQELACSLAATVYDELGWGWREDVYREALALELRNAGVDCRCEVTVPVMYKQSPLSYVSVRIDMLLDSCVAVELKAVSSPLPVRAVRQCERYVASVPDVAAGVAINFPDAPGRTVEHNFQEDSVKFSV